MERFQKMAVCQHMAPRDISQAVHEHIIAIPRLYQCGDTVPSPPPPRGSFSSPGVRDCDAAAESGWRGRGVTIIRMGSGMRDG